MLCMYIVRANINSLYRRIVYCNHHTIMGDHKGEKEQKQKDNF